MNKSTVLVVLANDAPTLHTHMVRVLRELYLRESENHGAIMLHASCVARGSAAAIIVGPKAAGKTSLAMTLCIGARCDYLANDRVVLAADADGRLDWAAPFPLACRLGVGTVQAFPEAAALLDGATTLHRAQSAKLFEPDDKHREARAQFGSEVKLELTPLELRERLGLRLSKGAYCRAIVLTRLDPACERASITRLRPDELVAGMQSEVLTPREEKWVEPWLIERREEERVMEARVRGQLECLSETCPGYLLQYGYGCVGGRKPDEPLNSIAHLLEQASQA